jgi:hypothetical protein
MAAKGQAKTGGRRKGTPNRLNADVKAMILGALNAAGGQEYLLQQAEKNPVAFLTLLGKILPLQVTGKDGGPLEHRIDTPAKESREEWLARHAKEAKEREQSVH